MNKKDKSMEINKLEQDTIKNTRFLGLTDKDVKERVLRGDINKIPKAPSRTIGQMFRANFFNIFNALNLVLSILVFIAGSPKNAIFAFVILVNSIIGVMQEINARNTLEKLSVLSMAQAKVIRNGEAKKISVEEIVIDDIVCLETGQQILADCEVVECDELEVDESMLTGEADPVYKLEGNQMLSGSFVVAGEGLARVTEVGGGTYSSQLAEEARKFKIINSELQRSISKIIKILLWLVGPIGVILAFTQMEFAGLDWRGAIIGSVSGIIGMVPEGLVLLTSATFIVSVVKLGKHNTLVQQLSATEVLARVDVLCVDKTGTITEGRLKLVDVVNIGSTAKDEIDFVLSALVNNLPSKNPTQLAILANYSNNPEVDILEKVPFSSRRKWGGIILKDHGAWVMGAPEILYGDRYEGVSQTIEEEARKGRRVLLLAKVNQETLKKGIYEEVQEEAIILIEDVIRPEAPEALKYFNEQDVNLKVISGDSPVTVSAVAIRAGVKDADRYVDARKLPTDLEALKPLVEKYTVFGRVTPHQKKLIVKALQANKHTVAMTGDGVNDVLALKESDCGIAMANGSDATKAVAQLVLLDSNFNSLPKVVSEGRKQINNLERVSELYLSKTAFFILLALIFTVIRAPYPIEPIQSALVGSCAIGIPSFFLAVLPYKGRIEGNFLKKILTACVPNGIIMGILVTIGYLLTHAWGVKFGEAKSVAVLVLIGVSLVILVRVSTPINKLKGYLILAMSFCSGICYFTPIGRWVFSLKPITISEFILASVLILVSIPLIFYSVKIMRRIVDVNK
jgi:cation-transporting ATPase E